MTVLGSLSPNVMKPLPEEARRTADSPAGPRGLACCRRRDERAVLSRHDMRVGVFLVPARPGDGGGRDIHCRRDHQAVPAAGLARPAPGRQAC